MPSDEYLRRLFLTALAAVGLYLSYRITQPFLLSIVAAVVLAVVFYPFHKKILEKVRNRHVAATLTTLLIVILAVVPITLVAMAAKEELRAVYHRINQRDQDVLVLAASGWVSGLTGIPVDELHATVVERFREGVGAMLGFATSIVTGVASSLLQLVVTLMTLFFLIRDGQGFLQHIRTKLPLPEGAVDRLLLKANESIVANVYGVIAVAAAQGALTGLAFWVARLPSPILWGLVTGFCSLIPVVGSGLVWLPAAIVLIAMGSWTKGVLMLAWGAGVVSMIDNFVRPFIVSGRVNMNPLFVFFALLGGINEFGLMGVFIGPVLLAMTFVLLDMLLSEPAGPSA